ncbi:MULTISPECIES: DUF484 family protein [unclassified Neptuniibacter]|jgi:uncharacterized protein YigA (DUF484 family)|uniref:DUF484 family protein n=1 Tax=unclassified Neptuniibacter TaxID=2630693 RepID=UPI0026E362B2|nr:MULTISPECIES: DUF484 family protein [unclassified Neptuniibacter]MDO6514999.1 DUF484 family protein [Neptuniibacter sp. 2_MG-2023]MDO6594242.1 DUF484 family protein [Neptuniibacter sp. 1_MG-2023]
MSDQLEQLTEAKVADFLQQHPDFFTRNAKLLEKLYVPHETGRAVSLVERQTTVLREKNQNLTSHLSDLIDIARHNDVQFEKTKRMVLALLESETLDDIAVAIDESLCQDFASDTTSLILFTHKPLDVNNLRLMDQDSASVISGLMSTNLPSCGQLSKAENEFIFAADAIKVQSAAVVPLVQGEALGLLAVGSFDPNYFTSSQGTVLLSYVGEVLSRVAYRIMRQQEY